ncbi:PREDICTED: uncharacterized protein LOC104609515 [Nelumbo nucifera]|uniref:Uncharacterized protein LOC104609515 n=1 Tax=Nelumbo nucifera TaxID=4432 RepID=A0A1U8B0D7_NELNU|nr:PREDICTED: uncharacterized protein LOC104609515 [Nelumbo nucifera]
MDVFSPDIVAEPLPPNFKAPTLEMYNGNTDSDNHLESFRALMIMYGYSGALTCRTFQATFKGATRWRPQKSVVSLMTVKKKRGESLRTYIDRFNKEELEVRDLDPLVSMHVAISGLLPSLALKCSIAKSQPKMKLEFLERAQKYIAVEEASATDAHERGIEHRDGAPEKKRKNGDQGRSNSNKKPLAYNQYMPLNSTRTQILMQIGQEKIMKWPEKLKKNEIEFHRGTGHDTEDCYDLKN